MISPEPAGLLRMGTRVVGRLLWGAVFCLLVTPGRGSEDAVSGGLELDFSKGVGSTGWIPLNDTVMGGQSTSRFEPIEGAMRFSGTLSQDNRGGFASVRGEDQSIDLARTPGLELRVRGDGREYSLMIWTDDTADRVYYSAAFTPPVGEWSTVALLWSEFKPYFRGFWVAQNDLDPSRIRSIGLMISDGKSGPFALDIEWLRSITPVNPEAEESMSASVT